MADVNINFPPAAAPTRALTAGEVEDMVIQAKADVEGQVSAVVGQVEDVTAQVEDNKIKVNEQNFYISIKRFPRLAGETDDSPRIQRGIAFIAAAGGGKLVLEAVKYILAASITMDINVKLEGQGSAQWRIGTTFSYTGTGAAVVYSSGSTRSLLKGILIKAETNAPNYQNFTGIDIQRGELLNIEDVTIIGAKRGIDCSGSVGALYLIDIDEITILNCLEEGILVRDTGSWKNGIRIGVKDISDNKIGIKASIGQGNTIEGNASEIGRNTEAGIVLTAGNWIIKGSLWIENSPKGIHVTGGHHTIDGEIYCIGKMIVDAGTLISNAKQFYSSPAYKGISNKNLKYWYSFDETSGSFCYDRSAYKKATIIDVANVTRNASNGFFRNTIGNSEISLPNEIDWSKSWTVVALGKGINTRNLLYIRASDNIASLFFRYNENGIQVWNNSPGFLGNIPTSTSQVLTSNMDWTVFSYDATIGRFSSYTKSGLVNTTLDYTIPAIFDVPKLVRLGNTSVDIDEFAVYDRVLDPLEIAAITDLKVLPTFDNRMVTLDSPDGSKWKQTIDNAGVPSWVKI